MKELFAVLIGFIVMFVIIALVYGGAGAVLYFGLPVLGVELTYW